MCRSVRTCPRPRFWFLADVSTDSRCGPRVYAGRLDRATTPAFDACRGRVPGHRRNHIDAAAHGIAVAGDRVKTRRCGGQRTSFRHGKARRQQEESRIRHTEIRQELLGRPAAPHPKDGKEGVSRNRTSTFLLGITKAGLTAESQPVSPSPCTAESAP